MPKMSNRRWSLHPVSDSLVAISTFAISLGAILEKGG
jgi:hypothetical protein